MSVFPLFVDLKGKLCIIVGGGHVASRKAEILLRFEPDLWVISPEVSGYMEGLEKKGLINIIRKEYSKEDIDGAILAVAATSSNEVNECVYRDAKARNIPVNVVDDPDKCSFIFPSVVNRGDLTIGISTSGTYPALSRKIRKITEEAFGEEYTEILNLLADFRIEVRKSDLNKCEKERILKRVVEEFYNEGVITGEALKRLISKYETEF